MEQNDWDNLMEAMGGVFIENLTDEQLKDYYSVCFNDYLACMKEMYKRKIEL